ncbi:transposase [Streptomyces sp. NPDC087219]|uniref:transposase n=1 Tax=Streptomyces sp. NPDC087219 TaxID=3365770 RepID=UPI003819075B
MPDELWELFRRVVPETVVIRPQGGGRRRAGDRECLAAIVFVATSGCTWRQVPPLFGPAWPTVRGIPPRIARRGIETSGRLGRHRWVIERTMSWLAGCNRLPRRYEREPEHFLAFTAIATNLINYRRLTG